MAGSGALLELSGDKQLAMALASMKESSAARIMRPAIARGMTVARREAKALVPRRTGALRRAISARTRVNRTRDGVTSMLYVRSGKDIVVNGKKHDPRKIAHLVEFGTRWAKPHPFLRAALGNKAGEIRMTITSRAKKELQKAVQKARSKGRVL